MFVHGHGTTNISGMWSNQSYLLVDPRRDTPVMDRKYRPTRTGQGKRNVTGMSSHVFFTVKYIYNTASCPAHCHNVLFNRNTCLCISPIFVIINVRKYVYLFFSVFTDMTMKFFITRIHLECTWTKCSMRSSLSSIFS